MTIVDKIEIFRAEGKPEEKVFYDGYFEAAKYYFSKLTDDQRLELLTDYCTFCGSSDPRCQCWNDE